MRSGYCIRNQEGIHFIIFAVVEWVDVFTRKEYANMVVESLQFCQQEKGLILYAWCLMSNHLHLIIAAKEGHNLSDILRDFKKFTSYKITKAIEDSKTESRRNWMLWIFKTAGQQNKRNKKYQFWQQNNHLKELETNHFMEQKLRYLHNNPVAAGIVSRPEDYVYFSARNYAGERGLLKVEFLE